MLSFPNAKINIGLFITEKRADGYHNLETLFFPVPMHDILEIVPSKDREDKLTLSGLSVPGSQSDNLVLKAVQLLRHDYDFPVVKMHLHKMIPTGAGMGGGSSDAVVCLQNINKQFELKISEEKLHQYALQLGSDCPFFLKNTPQFAQGRGELLTDVSLSLKGKYLLCLFPGIHISTAQSFANIQVANPPFHLKQINEIQFGEWKAHITNDFETNAFRLFPELAMWKEKLYNSGAVFALMSGSGSSLYGIFENLPDLNAFKAANLKLLKIS